MDTYNYKAKRLVTVTLAAVLIFLVAFSNVSGILITTPNTFDNGYYFVKDSYFHESILGWKGDNLETWYDNLHIPDNGYATKVVDISSWNGESELLLTVETPTNGADPIDKLIISDTNTSKIFFTKESFTHLRGARIDYYIFKNTQYLTIKIIDNDENGYNLNIKEVSIYTPQFHKYDLLTNDKAFNEDLYPSAKDYICENGIVTAEGIEHNARIFNVPSVAPYGKRYFDFHMVIPSVYKPTLNYLFSSLLNAPYVYYDIEMTIYDADNPYKNIKIVDEFEYLNYYPTMDTIDLSWWAGHYIRLELAITWYNNTAGIDTGLILNYLYIDETINDYRYSPGEIINAEEYSKSLYDTKITTLADVTSDQSGIRVVNNRVLLVDNNKDGGYISYLLENSIPIYDIDFTDCDLDNWVYDENYTQCTSEEGLMLNTTHTDFKTKAYLPLEMNDSYRLSTSFIFVQNDPTTESIFSILFNYDNIFDSGYALQFIKDPTTEDKIRLVRLYPSGYTSIYERKETILLNEEYNVEIIYDNGGITVYISNSEYISIHDEYFGIRYVGFMGYNSIVKTTTLIVESREPNAADRLHVRAMNQGPEDVTLAFYIDDIDRYGIARTLVAKAVIEHGKGFERVICPINPETIRFTSILSIEIVETFNWPIYIDELGFAGATPFGQSRPAWDYYRRGTASYIDNDMLVYNGDEPSGYESPYDYTDSTNEIFYPKLDVQTEQWQSLWQTRIISDIFTAERFGDENLTQVEYNELDGTLQEIKLIENMGTEQYGMVLNKEVNIAGDITFQIHVDFTTISAEDFVQIELTNNFNEPFLVVGRKFDTYYILIDGHEEQIALADGNSHYFTIKKESTTVTFQVDSTTVFTITKDTPALLQQIKNINIRAGTYDIFRVILGSASCEFKAGYTTLRHRLISETFNTLDAWNVTANANNVVDLSNNVLATQFADDVLKRKDLFWISESGAGYHGTYLSHEQQLDSNIIIDFIAIILGSEDPTSIGIQQISFGNTDEKITIIFRDLSDTDNATEFLIVINEDTLYTETITTSIFKKIRITKNENEIQITDLDRSTTILEHTFSTNFLIDTIAISQEIFYDHYYPNYYLDTLFVDSYYYSAGYNALESAVNTVLEENMYNSYIAGNWLTSYDGCDVSDIGITNENNYMKITPLNTLTQNIAITFSRNVSSDYDFMIDFRVNIESIDKIGSLTISLNNMNSYLHLEFTGSSIIISLHSTSGTDIITIQKTVLQYSSLRLIQEGNTLTFYSNINSVDILVPHLSLNIEPYRIENIDIITTFDFASPEPLLMMLGDITLKDALVTQYDAPWESEYVILNDHFSDLSNWEIKGINYYTSQTILQNATYLTTNFERPFQDGTDWYGNVYAYDYTFETDFYLDTRLTYLLDKNYGIISIILEDHLQYLDLFELRFTGEEQGHVTISLFINRVLVDSFSHSNDINNNVFRIMREGNTLSVLSDITGTNQLETIFTYTNEIEQLYIDRIKIKELSLGNNTVTNTMGINAIYVCTKSLPIDNPHPFNAITSFVAPDYSTDFATIDDFATYAYGNVATNEIPYVLNEGLKTLFDFSQFTYVPKGRTFWKDMVLVDDFLMTAHINTTISYNCIGYLTFEFLDNAYNIAFKVEIITTDVLTINVYIGEYLVIQYVDDSIIDADIWFRFGRKDSELLLGLYRGDYYIPIAPLIVLSNEIPVSHNSDVFALRITQSAIYTNEIFPNIISLKYLDLGSSSSYDNSSIITRETPEDLNFIASYDMFLKNETRLYLTALANYYVGENVTERLTFHIFLLEIDGIFNLDDAQYVGSIIFLDNDFDFHSHSLVIIGYEGLYEVIIMIDRRIPIQLLSLQATDITSHSEAEEDYEYSTSDFGWAEDFDKYSTTKRWVENVFTKEYYFSMYVFDDKRVIAFNTNVSFENGILRVNHTSYDEGRLYINFNPVNVTEYPFVAIDIMTDDIEENNSISLGVNNQYYDITPFTNRIQGFVTIHKNMYEILYPNNDQSVGQLVISFDKPTTFTIRKIEVYKIAKYNYLHTEESNENSYADIGYANNIDTAIVFLIGSAITPTREQQELNAVSFFKAKYPDVPIYYYYSEDANFPNWMKNTLRTSSKKYILVVFDELPTKLLEKYYYYDDYGRPFEKYLLQEWIERGNNLFWAGSEPFGKGIDDQGIVNPIDGDIVRKYLGEVINNTVVPDVIPTDIETNITTEGEMVGLQPYNPSWLVNYTAMPRYGGKLLAYYHNEEGVEYNITIHQGLELTNPLMFNNYWISGFVDSPISFINTIDSSVLLQIFMQFYLEPPSFDNVFGALLLHGPITLQKTFSFSKEYEQISLSASNYINVIIDNETIDFNIYDEKCLADYGVNNSINGFILQLNETFTAIYGISFIEKNTDMQREVYYFDSPEENIDTYLQMIEGGFSYSDAYNMLRGAGAAFLDTHPYENTIFELEMSVQPSTWIEGDIRTDVAGMMLELPTENIANSFYDGLFIGFKVVEDIDYTYPLYLVIMQYQGASDTYSLLFEQKIVNLGNSIDPGPNSVDNMNLQPLKLTIVKTITPSGQVRYDIYAKCYRVFGISEWDEVRAMQQANDGEYGMATRWFATSTSVTVQGYQASNIGFYSNRTNFFYNSLVIYPTSPEQTGDYISLDSGHTYMSIDGLWVDGQISTNYIDMKDVNYLVTLSNLFQNVWDTQTTRRVYIGVMNDLGHTCALAWDLGGFGYDILGEFAHVYFDDQASKNDEIFKIRIEIKENSDVVFSIYSEDDMGQSIVEEIFYHNNFMKPHLNGGTKVKLFIQTENTMVYIEEIRNGKFYTSPLTYSHGRGLQGAGEISYWLKGETEYSLKMFNSSISNSFIMGNYTESLGTFTTTFIANDTTNAVFTTTHNDNELFNIEIRDNILYFDNQSLDYQIYSGHIYTLTFNFNSSYQVLFIDDGTKEEKWEYDGTTINIDIGYTYHVSMSTTTGTLYLLEVSIGVINSDFSYKDLEGWSYNVDDNGLFTFSEDYFARKGILQLIVNPLYGPVNISVYGDDDQFLGYRCIDYNAFTTNHPVIIILDDFSIVGLHKYTLHFDNIVEFDKIALGKVKTITNFLYTSPSNPDILPSDAKYSVDLIDIPSVESVDVTLVNSLEFYYKIAEGDVLTVTLPLQASYMEDYNYYEKNLNLEIILANLYFTSTNFDPYDLNDTNYSGYHHIEYAVPIKDDNDWHYFSLNFMNLIAYISATQVGTEQSLNLLDVTNPYDYISNFYSVVKVKDFYVDGTHYTLSCSAGSSELKGFNLYAILPTINPSENTPSALLNTDSTWQPILSDDLGYINLKERLNLTFADVFAFDMTFTVLTEKESIGTLIINTNVEFSIDNPVSYQFSYDVANKYEEKEIKIPLNNLYGGYHTFIFRIHHTTFNDSSFNDYQPFFKVNIVLDKSFTLLKDSMKTVLDSNNFTFIPEWTVSNPDIYIDKTGEYFRNGDIDIPEWNGEYIPIYSNYSMSYFLTEWFEKAVPLAGDVIFNNITYNDMALGYSSITDYGTIEELGQIDSGFYSNDTQIVVSTTIRHLTEITPDLQYILHSNLNLSSFLAIYIDGFLIRQPNDFNASSFRNELLLADANGNFQFTMKPYDLTNTYNGDDISTTWHTAGFHTFVFVLNDLNAYNSLNFTLSIEGINEFISLVAQPTDYHIDLMDKLGQRRIFLALDEYTGGTNTFTYAPVDIARRSYSSKKYLMSYFYCDGLAIHTVKIVWIGVADYDETDGIGYAVFGYIYDQNTAHEYHEIQIQKVELQEMVPCSTTTQSNYQSINNLEVKNLQTQDLENIKLYTATTSGDTSINHDLLAVQENSYTMEITSVGTTLELNDVINIEYWNLFDEHYNTGPIDYLVLNITDNNVEGFNTTQFRITLQDRVITINLLTKELHVLYNGMYIAHFLNSLSVEFNNHYDGNFIFTSQVLLKLFSYDYVVPDERTVTPQSLLYAQQTLEDYLLNYDWEGAFLQFVKSSWNNFINYLRYNFYCPLKQFIDVLKSGELLDRWIENADEHFHIYAILGSIMLLTGGLMLYGNIQGRFLTFIVKKTFIIAGIMLVGMVILDMTGGPNWIASGLSAMFNTLKAKIVEFFSNPGKYILQFFRNVLVSAKVVFSKTKDFLISWGNRIKTSFINFWQKITAIFNLLKSFLTGELSFNDFMRTLGSLLKGDFTDWAEKKYYYLLRFILLLEWVFHIGGCTGIVSKEEYPYVQSNADMLLHLNYRAHNRENYNFGGENLFMVYLKTIANEIAKSEGVAIGGNEAAQVKYIAEVLRKTGFSVVISDSLGANISTVYVPNTKKLGVTNPNDVRNPDSLNQSADIVIYKVIGAEDEISYEMFFGMSDNFVIPGINLGTGLKESTFMTIMEMFLARFSITALWQDVRDAIFDPNNFFRGLAISQIPGDILMVLSDIDEPSHQAQDLLSKKIKNTKEWEFWKKEAVGKNIDFDNPSSWSQSDRMLLEYIEKLSPQNALSSLELGNTFKFGTRELLEFGTKLVGSFLQWGIFWPQTIYTTLLGTVMGLKEQLMWSAMSLLLKAKGMSSQRIVLITQKTQGTSSYKFLQAFAHNYWFHSMMEWMYDLGPAADILNDLAYYGGAESLEDLDHYEPPVTQSLVQKLLLTTNGRQPTLDEFRFDEDNRNRIAQELELKAKMEMLQLRPHFHNLITEQDGIDLLNKVKSGEITNLSDEDVRIIRDYFEITVDDLLKPAKAVNRFATNFIKFLDGENNAEKLTKLMKLEKVNGDTFLKIQMGSEEINLKIDPDTIQESGFYQTLLLINAQDNIKKILAKATIGVALNDDGSINKKICGDELEELIAISEGIKDTAIYQLLEEFIKMEKEIDNDAVFADGNSIGNEQYQLLFEHSMLDFGMYILTQIRNYLIGHKALAETQQLTLDLIGALFIMNCPQAKENYKARMTSQIRNIIKQGQRKVIAGIGNPFLSLELNPVTGEVTDVKNNLIGESKINTENILNKLFKSQSETRLSPTGADATSEGKTYFFIIKENEGVFSYKCLQVDSLIVHEYKVRQDHLRFNKKATNIVTTDRMTEEARKVFEELGVMDKIDSVDYVPTFDIPLGGTAGIRRIVESFQKTFGIYPDSTKSFTVDEFKRKIEEKSDELNINLGLLLKKWVLKQSIIALFQKEPSVQVDENGFIVFKLDDGTEVVYSIKSEKDSLSYFNHKQVAEQMKHTAEIEIFEGIKIVKGDGTIEYKKTITFTDTGTGEEVADTIKLSAYTGMFSSSVAKSNIVDLHYPNNKEIWLSSSIFHAQFNKDGVKYNRYYIIKKDGTTLVANTFTDLKDKIKNEYKNEEDLLTNPPIASVFYEKSNGNFKDTNEGNIIKTLAVGLEDKLLNGETTEPLGDVCLNFELEIFNTALLPKSNPNYSPHISNYLEILTSMTKIDDFRTYMDICNSKYESIRDDIKTMENSEQKYKMLMGAIERTVINPSIELLESDMLTKPMEKQYSQAYSDQSNTLNRFKDTTNVRIVGSAIHSAVQIIKNMVLYYKNIRQEKVSYVFSIQNTIQNSNGRGFVVEVTFRASPQGDYKYDLTNVITAINKLSFKDSIGESADGTTIIYINDILKYQSNSLIDQSKIEAINKLIQQNLDVGKDVIKEDGTIKNLTPKQDATKFLAVRFTEDSEGNKALYLSLSSLINALETLIGKRNSIEYRVDLQNLWNKNLQIKYGLELVNLKSPDGGRILLQSMPELKEALIEGCMYINKINYQRANNRINKIISINDLVDVLKIVFQQSRTVRINSLTYITRSIVAENDRSQGLNDILTVIMKFALELFEIMTDYGQIKPVDYTKYKFERFIFTLPSSIANYRKIWDKLHTEWMINTRNKKSKNQEVNVITEAFIENYITKMKNEGEIVDGSIEEIVLSVIKDIIENRKAMPVPLTVKKDENGNLISIKEEEKIFRELYDIISTQVEIDRIYTLDHVDYVKLYAKYSLITAYKTIMEIGGLTTRLELRQSVRNFINNLMKEVREGYYNTDIDFARMFAACINFRKVIRDYI